MTHAWSGSRAHDATEVYCSRPAGRDGRRGPWRVDEAAGVRTHDRLGDYMVGSDAPALGLPPRPVRGTAPRLRAGLPLSTARECANVARACTEHAGLTASVEQRTVRALAATEDWVTDAARLVMFGFEAAIGLGAGCALPIGYAGLRLTMTPTAQRTHAAIDPATPPVGGVATEGADHAT